LWLFEGSGVQETYSGSGSSSRRLGQFPATAVLPMASLMNRAWLVAQALFGLTGHIVRNVSRTKSPRIPAVCWGIRYLFGSGLWGKRECPFSLFHQPVPTSPVRASGRTGEVQAKHPPSHAREQPGRQKLHQRLG